MKPTFVGNVIHMFIVQIFLLQNIQERFFAMFVNLSRPGLVLDTS
jgi:hypothetical protein